LKFYIFLFLFKFDTFGKISLKMQLIEEGMMDSFTSIVFIVKSINVE